MRWKRNLIVGAMIMGVLTTAAGCAVQQAGHVDLVATTGCTSVQVEQSVQDRMTTLRVKAAGCDAAGRAQAARDVVAARVAGAVWESLRKAVDVVEVRVTGPYIQRAKPAVHLGSDLAQRFEVGAALSVTSRPIGAGDLVWFLLPTAYVAAAVAMTMVVRRLHRAGIVLILFK